jgi:plasmid maintenance system antidote protein VapI
MHIIKITTPIAADKLEVAFCTQEEIWLYMNMKVVYQSTEGAVFQLYIQKFLFFVMAAILDTGRR